ncbi:MAG: lamin tail domain-containing protein, partial [Patescibacteria group bacterium]
GGTNKFLANLLSSQTSEESETISLDAPRESATISDVVASAKKSKAVKQSVVQKQKCIATSSNAMRGSVLINEVAWMGSENDAKREWVELKNISPNAISLTRWEFLDKSGKIDVRFDSNTSIASQGFLVLARGKEFTGTINNSDETLSLFDNKCVLIDIVEANPAWPAGDAREWKTAERGADLSWHTSASLGGTLGKENSTPISNATSKNSVPTLVSTTVPLIPATSTNMIGGPTPSGYIGQPNTTQLFRVLISEVMTGMKGSADYDFVELYNDSDSPAVLTGLSIKKKSSTGKESSLVAESRLMGKTIPAHQYFLLASDGGYTGNAKADVIWPSSYSLASAKNGIVLYGTNNKVMDSASWDTIPDGASFVRDGWNSALFHINSSPTPQNSIYN